MTSCICSPNHPERVMVCPVHNELGYPEGRTTMSAIKTFADSDLGGLVIGFVLVLAICVGFGLFVAYA